MRSVDHDPAKFAELMRMAMVDALPFVERWFERMIEAKEQARKMKRK